ncbi:MAG: hypothetical protein FJX53_09505 [Alphaproteobacteria bacterium]|nr:hypothetical protein [Alphaproteobacteria bacterium]
MLVAAGASVAVRRGRSGAFEIVRDGRLVYSKLATGRFPDASEVAGLAEAD